MSIDVSATVASRDRGACEPGDGLAVCLRCAARLDAFEARLRALEARFGPRDQADADLMLALRESSRGLVFTTRMVWVRRDRDDGLARALLAADIDSPKQLGKLLARLAGVDIGGLVVTRTKDTRDGAQWSIARL
jgi:hypothetical protein